MELLSNQIHLDSADAAAEYYYRQGWTDGLPVIPPTPDRVKEMLKAADLFPAQVIGEIKERKRIFTAEKIAINAVMAGCLPEYMPVIVAAVKAICEPEFGLHGPTASTGGAGILLIINGPIAQQLNISSGENFFASTSRANATIARAIRLLLLNVGGNRLFDRTTLGHPGKVMCVAELEDPIWEPLHVQRGFNRSDSTVTVFAAEAPNQVQNHYGSTPEQILLTIADRMASLGSFSMIWDIDLDYQCAVVICPEHLQTLKKYGWSKRDVQEFLYRHARRPITDLIKAGLVDEKKIKNKDEMVAAVSDPSHILLITGGGKAGRFSAYLPGWGARSISRPVTKKINLYGCADDG